MYILNLKVNSILFEIEVQTSKAKKFYFLPAFMPVEDTNGQTVGRKAIEQRGQVDLLKKGQ